MHNLAPLIYDLAIILAVAGIVVVIFQRIHQPVVLGYIVAGIILGPYTPPYVLVSDMTNIRILSELGVIFLMFSLGLEFSFQKLIQVGFSASVTGFLEVILMILIGYLAGMMLGWGLYDCMFLGAALSISSTTIIIKAIGELGLKTKRFAELIFGILIVEDLLAILLLVALSTIVITQNIFSYEMIFASVKLILVVGGWFLVGYFIVPPLFRKIANYISEETLTIISVALCLVLVCIAAAFNYSTALGAFIMGSILAETVLIHRIENLIRPIRDIFAAVFFVSVGMLIDPLVIVENWPVVIFLSLVTVFGKIITTSLAAILSGQSLDTSVRVGFSMAQIGEFSFIIAALGLSLKVTNYKLYPLVVAVSGITTFTTPYLIRFSGYFSNKLQKRLSPRMKYFLESYATWVYRTQATAQTNALFRIVSIRLLVNGILIAIIFSLVHYLIFIEYKLFSRHYWLNNILFLFVSLALASPFIWGMLFSFKRIKIPEYTKISLNPMVFIIWVITFSEIAILSLVYYHSGIIIALFLALGMIFFILAYRQLEKSYHWFEQQFIHNIKTKADSHKSRYEELAPWDTHLVEIEVGEKSPFVGKTLGQSHIRERYGVNIVAISHGSRVIPAPRGNEKIIAHDKLIVLGNDKQIDAFEQHVKRVSMPEPSSSFLSNFTLKSILLEPDHPFIGKTIRDSKIREHFNGQVVGLERNNRRYLNPVPETVLHVDDLLLIVGEVDKIENMNWKNFRN